MADNFSTETVASPSIVFASDDITSVHWPYAKMAFGADGTATIVSASVGLPVGDAGGSLTVDAPVGTPVFVQLSDGTSSIATLPVSLASVPSHAVTNAGTFAVQAVCTNAGTFATQAVCTNAGTFAVQVDGDALTALQLLDDAVYVDDADWTDSTSKHLLVGGLYQSTPQTVTDGDVAPFNITSTGALHVAVQNTLTVASHAVTNAGTFAVQAAQSGTWDIGTVTTVSAVTAITNALPAGTNNIGDVDILSIAAGDNNIGNVDIASALPAGTNAIGKLAANSGVDIGDVDVTSISAGSNLIGDVGLQGRTSGGLTVFRSIDLDESEEEVKSSAGQVYGGIAINLTSGVIYLKLYNATAANVTVGTTTPFMTIPVPTAGSTNGAGFVFNIPQGVALDTAICAAATTGVADNDTGAPGANALVVNLFYK